APGPHCAALARPGPRSRPSRARSARSSRPGRRRRRACPRRRRRSRTRAVAPIPAAGAHASAAPPLSRLESTYYHRLVTAATAAGGTHRAMETRTIAPSTLSAALRDQHAVVTGASRGIGAAIAAELGRLGASLTLMARTEASLQAQRLALEER